MRLAAHKRCGHAERVQQSEVCSSISLLGGACSPLYLKVGCSWQTLEKSVQPVEALASCAFLRSLSRGGCYELPSDADFFGSLST